MVATRLLIPLILFRLMAVIMVQSWFVPDEVYQSSEVAHHMVFGTGHLSWEWTHALRSIIHPGMIAVVYKILQIWGIDSQGFIAEMPRILHAIMFAVGDFFYAKLANRLHMTSDGAMYSLVSYVSCWFVFYCSPRTLSNSLETVLTIVALNWYPFEGRAYRGPIWPYITLGMVTIIIRPTAALIWIVFGIGHLRTLGTKNAIKLMIFTVLPAATCVGLSAFCLDTAWNGRFTFSLWNFVKFNVFDGGSAHFGVHPWYWYFSEGLTSVLTVQLLPIIIGLFCRFRPTLLPLYAAGFYILFHSCLPHKEQRFLLPIIPLLTIYAGSFFADKSLRVRKEILLRLMIFINIPIAIYTGIRHQVGPYDAADAVMMMSADDQNVRLIALMPCYSIPGHSYFHDKVQMIRQLDCSPPNLDNMKIDNRLDEADEFHDNPIEWLEKHREEMNGYGYAVIYEKTYERAQTWLTANDFVKCHSVFHANVLTSSRQDHYINILCRRPVK